MVRNDVAGCCPTPNVSLPLCPCECERIWKLRELHQHPRSVIKQQETRCCQEIQTISRRKLGAYALQKHVAVSHIQGKTLCFN